MKLNGIKKAALSFFLPGILIFYSNILANPQSATTINGLYKKLSVVKTAPDSLSLLCSLVWNINWTDPDRTYNYGTKVLEMIGKEKNIEQLAEVYDAAALAYWVKGDLKKARNYYNKALSLGIKNKIDIRIAWENYNLADLSLRENKFKDARYYISNSKEAFKKINDMQMVIRCDLLLSRAENDKTKMIGTLLVSDSLKYQLSIAKNAKDSASIYCWIIWSLEKPEPKVILNYGLKALELKDRIDDKEKLAEVYDAAALAYRINMNYKESKELYKKALSIGLKYNLPNRIAWENNNLANLSSEEKIFHDVKKYAVDSRKAFLSLNNINMALNNDWLLINSNHTEFIDTALNDIKIAVSRTDDPNNILNHYFNIIYLYGKKENKTKSMLYAMKALEIAEETNNQKAVLSIYYQIANYLRDYQANYEIALLYYNKIYEIYSKNNDKINIAGILNEIGNVQHFIGNDSLAVNYFNKSLEIAEKINHRPTRVTAYKNLGEIYYLQHKYDEALKYLLQSFQTGCDSCTPISFHDVLIDLGNVYLKIKDYKNALKYFNNSLTLADSVGANYEKAVSFSSLADLYKSLSNNGTAVRFYQSALNNAVTANSLSLQKDIAYKLGGVYSAIKNYPLAYKYLLISKSISDSLNKISNAENLARLETKFEIQNLKSQKENEIKENKLRADAEIRKQSQLKYFFIIAFSLTTVLFLVIYYAFRRKKRDSMLLEQQNTQIEEMSERVHFADQKKLNFFTNISHEFRTPLTLILGPVEKLIRENPVTDSSHSLLKIIHRNAFQLYSLINQLLDIRKLDSGKIKLKVARTEIVHHCKIIYSIFSHLAEKKNINYRFINNEEEISCWFDHDILEKVLNNLLSNAFKFTYAGGEINLNISGASENGKDISYVKIVVSDNGKGIPGDQLKFIFDRYYQAENSNNGFDIGSGIGLAYTKELIELHKGKINVESSVNIGTTFTVILPVHYSDFTADEIKNEECKTVNNDEQTISQQFLAPQDLITSSEKELSSGSQNLCNNKTNNEENSPIILIVEDNNDLREFIKNILEDSYRIIEAADGNDGYRLANENIPDIIISDIMMPGMDGLEFCNKIKNDIHTNHIPVLLLTARSGEENEIEGLKSGADDYLTKPFNSEILEMRLKRLITSRERLREYFTREFLLNPKEVKLLSPDDEFLKKAVQIVEENISSHNLNPDYLMKELGVSRTQLFRKLKAVTNYSASQFIRNIKLKRAAQLLQNTSYNISEILYMSGFNSPSYFSVCFKEMYGCLPKEFQSKADESFVLKN